MIYISIKVNIIHIFHVNIHSLITFFHRRFVYIHTFFHRQIICICRLAIYLCDIWHASYERRLHSSLVAPSKPIWAGFAFTIGKICPWSIRTVTSHLSLPVVLRRATIIYMHIFAGENGDAVTCTRAHEKIRLDFFRAEPLYVLYIAGKNVKNCKVTYARGFFASIYCFIWIKCNWGNMVIGNCWKSS